MWSNRITESDKLEKNSVSKSFKNCKQQLTIVVIYRIVAATFRKIGQAIIIQILEDS
jgi:hypothetical protein